MTDTKPIPRVTHDEAESALTELELADRWTKHVGVLERYIEQQRALSATRQADVATVRATFEYATRSWDSEHPKRIEALEAIDRLGRE